MGEKAKQAKNERIKGIELIEWEATTPSGGWEVRRANTQKKFFLILE